MKNKRNFYSIALASALLVFVVLIPAASSAQVTRIGNGSDPAIYDSTVVWTDNGVIHVYDLSTKTDTTVDSSAASHPAIYGNKLVWHDENSGTPRLTVYDIDTAARSYITKDVDSYSIPAIYGSRIVWSANDSVYLRDISISKQEKIGNGSYPDIYDTKIVYYSYTEEPDRDMTIRMYDVNTKEKITVASHGDPNLPHIWDTKVIWADAYNHEGYIAMYDISTKNITDVTQPLGTDPHGNEYGASTGTHIAIQNDKIVYHKSVDDYEGKSGVYVYNISTGQSALIYIYPEEIHTTPEVYNNTVAWGTYSSVGGVTIDNGIYVSDLSSTDTLPPVAAFTANVSSGTAPLIVLFTDTGTGGTPTSWLWDFGDGITSKHAQTATHTFTNPGTYSVTLTVTNDAGSSTVKKSNFITVTPPQAPAADFFSPEVNDLRDFGESIPINETVSFADNSTGSPTSWLWDFGDGATSTARNPEHAYSARGGYTVNLTVNNSFGSNTTSKYGYVLVGIIDAPAIPAYFSSDVTSGNAPLTVTFVDDLDAELPNYPIWREWNFGDGVVQTYMVDDNDSATPYATHVYEKPGNYTVTLYMDNRGGNSIITKYHYITVTDPESADPKTENGSSDDSSSSSGGSSHSSSGSSGGGGGSPEPAKNVEVKELSQVFITNGKAVKFDFNKNATCVVYVGFDAKRTLGKTTTVVEQLKNRSSLVSELPEGEVYKSFNIWVGNGETASSKNIENPVIGFKVEKTWIQDEGIDQASITLNRYNDKKWEQLPASLSWEDDSFLYFTAETPGFSSFVIIGESKSTSGESETGVKLESETRMVNETDEENKGPEAEQETASKESMIAPGFEVIYGLVGLFAVFLYKLK